MLFDPLYLVLLAPALVLSLWAQWRVKRNYAKYSEVPSSTGLTGAQLARRMLDGNGLGNVQVEEVNGFLSDHYDPVHRVLRLSPGVYRSRSVAASGIAAHEAGHALQHAKAYAPLALRTALVPAAQVGSNLSWLLLMGGVVLQWGGLIWAGVALFSAAVLFSLVTLPVEFDASRRAKESLPALGLVSPSDRDGVAAVLNSAAMTYVAAAAMAVLQLVYFVLRANSSRD